VKLVLDRYKDKTVLITGHTGFKGSWLVAWLQLLGAKVVGVALEPPTNPCHFDVARLDQQIIDHRVDIRDLDALQQVVETSQPDFVFHLAAQPLVRQAYQNPLETYTTNVLGTIHLLESLRALTKKCHAVFITSDKCYDNVEWVWGYRETDALGGEDPYSASKGAAEIAIRSYVKSYFSSANSSVRIAVGRAGNVIGGGDWASDRIVPDCVRAWSQGDVVDLRSPHATRPWQHVLEPLSGYLVLGAQLVTQAQFHGEPFNFGPPAHQNHTVLELVQAMGEHWEQVRWKDISDQHDGPHESGLLKLNCDKALSYLQWQAVLSFEETVRMTTEWYKHFYQQSEGSMLAFTLDQIGEYTAIVKKKGLPWVP
jgi:CDP-glucose 4,6-dehydratase